ncbi:MAG: ABC transporter ATP-binding protein [Candidatus Phosphoribacter sp.]|nr:ABC transporter ATP-binding protein [Actinomycetales bacterium]
MNPVVALRNVTRDFDLEHGGGASIKHLFLGRGRGRSEHFRALDDVSFDIARGDTVALVGHNGSGKSTALKLIAGIYPPSSGSVLVDGRVTALLELGAGFHPELTGRENTFLAGALAGLTRRHMAANVEKIKRFSALDEFFEAPVKVYSSGMFVRLGFAVAVHLDPEILIVDEVVAVGDEQFQRQCFDHLHELRRRGVTIIFVTHALGLVEQLADSAVWLDHGRVAMIGSARDVVDAYLADVNKAERERLRRDRQEEADLASAASGTDPAPLRDDAPGEAEQGSSGKSSRRGSGEAEVLDVTFHDTDGEAIDVVEYGQHFSIRVHFRAHERLDRPNIGLGMWSEQGWPIAGPNTRLADFEIDALSGEGSVDFTVERCPFAPGRLSISAAITDASTTHVYDWREKEFELRVVPSTGLSPTGMVEIAGSWSGPRPAPASARPAGPIT